MIEIETCDIPLESSMKNFWLWFHLLSHTILQVGSKGIRMITWERCFEWNFAFINRTWIGVLSKRLIYSCKRVWPIMEALGRRHARFILKPRKHIHWVSLHGLNLIDLQWKHQSSWQVNTNVFLRVRKCCLDVRHMRQFWLLRFGCCLQILIKDILKNQSQSWGVFINHEKEADEIRMKWNDPRIILHWLLSRNIFSDWDW